MKSPKTEQVGLRLEPELREKLQVLADQDQRTLSSMIRKILSEAMSAGDTSKLVGTLLELHHRTPSPDGQSTSNT